MANHLTFKRSNTILYCRNWRDTVAFYQRLLALPVTYATDWFVEFQLTAEAHLSVADDSRATIKSSGGAGITITLQVENITAAWSYLECSGLSPGPIREHAWGAQVFYFYDPEGHRLEVWSEV
jgi:catechol 2,3-dioxygenase-like lactoylglutathione lyase family enzyme